MRARTSAAEAGRSEGRLAEEPNDEFAEPVGQAIERFGRLGGDFLEQAGEGSGGEDGAALGQGVEGGAEAVEIGGGGERGVVVDLLGGEGIQACQQWHR